MIKGWTADFNAQRPLFHVSETDGAPPTRIRMADLKAVFFVKSLIGNAAYDERKEFGGPVQGRKVQVTFKDGEVLVGSTQGYQADRPGFFLVPADPQSNNDRIYVVAGAVQTVSFETMSR